MGIPVLVMGKSGSGKSTSLRNFKDNIGVINVLGKPLPFRNTLPCIKTDDYTEVMKTLVGSKADSIVIDDAGYLMTNQFMRGHSKSGAGNAIFSFYNDNGKKTEIKRGSRITSIRKLSEKWGWSKDKVRRFLDELEADGMVTQKRDTHSTLITIVKYDFYQSSGRQTGQQRDANRNQTGNRREQTKNDKRMIKEGEEKPTLFEISQFAAERKLSVKPERFFEYYEKRDWRTAQGNPVADWKELLLEWERTEYQKPGEKKTGYAGIRNLAEEW